nr:MAG TPA: hypothetical protein [Caudoviricetes sp.]
MTFAENINRICAERGTNLTADSKYPNYFPRRELYDFC